MSSSTNKRNRSCGSSTNSNLDEEVKKQKKSTNLEPKVNDTCDDVMDEALRKLGNLKHSNPVLELNIDVASIATAPDISFSSGCTKQGSFLSRLIHPLPLSHFLSSCFRQKAVCVRSNTSTDVDANLRRIRDINENYMYGLDVEQILTETSSDSIFLWLHNNHSRNSNKRHATNPNSKTAQNDNNTTTNTTALKSIEIPDPQTAYLLHKTSHHATYCRAPPELEQPLISKMLRDTGIGCGQYDPSSTSSTTMGRGEVEVFVGTEGHLTDWHYDFQENFTVQLSGSKRWTLRQGSVRYPIRGMTPHYCTPGDIIENQLKAARLSDEGIRFEAKQENGFGGEVEVVLRPGDVLYFPAGMWHKVETLEYGVSINISLMGMNYANLVCKALEHVLMKKDDWRETVCSSSSSLSCNRGGVNQRNTSIIEKDQDQVNYDENDHSLENNTCIVTHKMERLLNSLPDIVQDFCKNCGADGLIPPVLRHPPSFEIVSDDLVGKDDDVNDEKGHKSDSGENSANSLDGRIETISDDGIVEAEERCSSSHTESDTAQDIEMIQDGDDDEEAEEIVDVLSFQGPGKWTSKRPSLQHRVAKNPLATLTKTEDITSSSESLKGDNDVFTYILNVCFAGNEVMESAVRVILRDCPEEGLLRKCCDVEANGGDFGEILTSSEDGTPHALFYYGYFSWVNFSY